MTDKSNNKNQNVESLKNYDEEIRDEIRGNIKSLDEIVDKLLREKEEPIVNAEVQIILKSIDLYYLNLNSDNE